MPWCRKTPTKRSCTAAASYVVCNNTGTGYSFLVEVYQDTNYTTSLQNNTLYLPAHSCHFVDLVTANVASSIKVTP